MNNLTVTEAKEFLDSLRELAKLKAHYILGENQDNFIEVRLHKDGNLYVAFYKEDWHNDEREVLITVEDLLADDLEELRLQRETLDANKNKKLKKLPSEEPFN